MVSCIIILLRELHKFMCVFQNINLCVFFKNTIDKQSGMWYHNIVATVLLCLVRFVKENSLFVNLSLQIITQIFSIIFLLFILPLWLKQLNLKSQHIKKSA